MIHRGRFVLVVQDHVKSLKSSFFSPLLLALWCSNPATILSTSRYVSVPVPLGMRKEIVTTLLSQIVARCDTLKLQQWSFSDDLVTTSRSLGLGWVSWLGCNIITLKRGYLKVRKVKITFSPLFFVKLYFVTNQLQRPQAMFMVESQGWIVYIGGIS